MAGRDELRKRIVDAIEAHRDEIIGVAETIRQNPEIGNEERMASALLASKMRDLGFEVEMPAGGLETAFVAALHGRAEGPVVAVLAEYDALLGIGHGCGHNLIAGSGLASAIGLHAVMPEIDGIFQVVGTPAEETTGGKIPLVDNGVFDDVDAALMVHYGDHTGVPTSYPEGTSLALVGTTVEYFGKPAHAAADPYNGVNALNAVIKLFTGLDALRQHVTMDTRIHGIITHGGDAANVVPHYASAFIEVRSASLEGLEDLVAKFDKVAEGAALMTGCEMKLTRGDTFYDMRSNYIVAERYLENMKEVGLEIVPRTSRRGMGSTDFGNVSYKAPSVTGSFLISHEPMPGHSQEVVEASGSEFGYDQLIKVSKAMALTAFDLMTDADLLKSAKDQLANWDQVAQG
ncbi:MAG TPA: M20 family metallopeptidase [Thermomicrobiales bacterium]|nr:M20 family metallopeptidase [Thermomicrobiales bacterium]